MRIKSIFTPINSIYLPLHKKDALMVYSQKIDKRSILVDRFNYLNQFSIYNLLGTDIFPEPLENYNENIFENICSSTSTEIIQKEGIISVLWSGGVDSTCIIASLLKEGISKKNLRILHTKESIEEYPEFYRYLLKEKIDCITIVNSNSSTVKQAIEEGYLITGSCADSLFEESSFYKNPDAWNVYYKDYLTSLGLGIIIPQFEGKINYHKLNITRWQQLAWLMEFSAGYTVDYLAVPTLFQSTKNIIHFFANELFQRWSITKFLNNPKTVMDNTHYKIEPKQVIYSFNKDKDYLYKSKGFSRLHLSRYFDTIKFSYNTDTGIKFFNTNSNDNNELKQLIHRELGFYRKH